MNYQQLQALLQGQAFTVPKQPSMSVEGFRLPRDETLQGGAVNLKRPVQQAFYPGLNSGHPYQRKRKKRKANYTSVIDRMRHDVSVDPHIGKRKRLFDQLDLEPELKKQKTMVEDFLSTAKPAGYQVSVKPRKVTFNEPDQEEQKVSDKFEEVPDYEVNVKKGDTAEPTPEPDDMDKVVPTKLDAAMQHAESLPDISTEAEDDVRARFQQQFTDTTQSTEPEPAAQQPDPGLQTPAARAPGMRPPGPVTPYEYIDLDSVPPDMLHTGKRLNFDDMGAEPQSNVEMLEPAQQPEPVVQQPDPVVQQPDPVVQQPDPVVQQPDPVVQQPDPVVQQPDPVVQQP